MRYALGWVTLGLFVAVLVVLWHDRRESGSLDDLDGVTIERAVNGGTR